MHVVATAGHVDHGKSTLVRALTGMEPDRWAEERRRGLTIDLGFAWTVLPGGAEVAFVDVPGHERFVPNMLAGVGPVPAVLIVVAADEGWMPQSAEHLAAVDALGVRHGLLAVTRCDLADPGPAAAEAADRIARTSLGTVPVVAVSGTTGRGLDALRAALAGLVGRLPQPAVDADVRLWVDRSFTVGGAGTVVTGTLPAGTLRTGDELVLASTGQRVRVRALQALGRPADTVTAVARVAVNLRGVDRHALRRGDALLSAGRWLHTELLDALLDAPSHYPADDYPAGDGPADDYPAGDGPAGDAPADARADDARAEAPTRLVLHVGSAAVPVRVRPLGGPAVRLHLAQPLPLRVGDRVLLRDPGRHRVVGGATVLDVRPPALRRRGAARERAAELAGLRRCAVGGATELHLRHRGFVRGDELRAMGLPPAGQPVAGDWHAPAEQWRTLAGRLGPEVDRWQRTHPLERGMPADMLRRRLGLPDPALTGPLVAAAGLVTTGGRVHRRGAATTALPAQLEAAVQALTIELTERPFAAPDANRLAELHIGPREIAAAARAGRLLKIADGIVLLPDAVERAARTLATVRQPFTLSEARQALRTTRRVAVPLLEMLDRQRITEQLPDSTRRLRRPTG